jgi:hypothetical protein
MIPPVLLQMCAGDKTGPERLLDFEFVPAVVCTYADPLSLLTVGLIVYGAIGASMYITTGDLRIPFVLVLTIGGAIIPQIAGPGLIVISLILILIGAGTITYLYYQYSR